MANGAFEAHASSLNRVLKYLVIVCLLLVDLWLIFVMFSGYIDRRRFEEILQAENSGATYETLYYDAAKFRARIADLLDVRCAQRDALAFYRLSTMHVRQQLAAAYGLGTSARDRLRAALRRYATQIDVDATIFGSGDRWALMPKRLVFREGISEAEQAAIREQLEKEQAEITAALAAEIGAKYEQLGELIKAEEKELGEAAGSADLAWSGAADRLSNLDSYVFNLSAVRALDARAEEFKGMFTADESSSVANKAFIQRLIADEIASSGTSIRDATALVAELINPSRGVTADVLLNLDCREATRPIGPAIDAFYKGNVRDQLIQAISATGTGSQLPQAELVRDLDAAWADAVAKIGAATPFGAASALANPFGWVKRFGTQSITIQTLIVTVLFGVAGALSMNALQLSRRGVWLATADPGWGEIAVSVVLGACAALMVFLLATLGLIVVSDGQSAAGDFSTVGASLVGVLGFISGMLNDEAFGRLKQVGSRFLGTPGAEALPAEIAADDLSASLRRAGCRRFAALVAMHDVAARLGLEAGKLTLFAPSDLALDRLSAEVWGRLTATAAAPDFDGFLEGLVHAGVLTAEDLAARQALTMRNGAKLAVTRDQAQGMLSVGGAPVRLTGVLSWRASPIFVIDGLPVVTP